MERITLKEITNAKELDYPYIMEYVIEHGEAAMQWLLELQESKGKPDKSGKERKKSFIEIRQEFVMKYMPELIPPEKPKKATMEDGAKKLRALLEAAKGKKK